MLRMLCCLPKCLPPPPPPPLPPPRGAGRVAIYAPSQAAYKLAASKVQDVTGESVKVRRRDLLDAMHACLPAAFLEALPSCCLVLFLFLTHGCLLSCPGDPIRLRQSGVAATHPPLCSH